MKNKLTYILFAVLIFGCSASGKKDQDSEQKSGVTISGKVAFPQDGFILLEKVAGYKADAVDTIQLAEDNTYSHFVNLEQPGYFRLNFYDKQYVMVILHQDNLEVNVDGNKNTGAVEIKGSKDHDFISEVQTMIQNFQTSEPVNKLNQEFGEASQNGDQEQIKALQEKYIELESQHKVELAAKFKSMSASLATISLLQSGRVLDKDKNFDVYEDVANKAKAAMPNSDLVAQFVEEIEQLKKLAIGKVAPEISLPNPDGKIVPLSSLRGKYVLVDFWAKWCRPCRIENPNVVRLYNKYNDKGFEVYGVSLDRRKEDWVQAIQEDGLNWTQVSDLKFWQSEAAQIYNVKAIPFALLLDPEGVIIGKNLRGVALENKLKEVFGEI